MSHFRLSELGCVRKLITRLYKLIRRHLVRKKDTRYIKKDKNRYQNDR